MDENDNNTNNNKQYFSSLKFVKQNGPNFSYSAGILPYSIDKFGTVYVLLGKGIDGTWSDFGGKMEPSVDKFKPENTASREFYEETMGSVLPINTVRDILKNPLSYKKITSKGPNNIYYYLYLIQIPYKYYRHYFQKIFSFLKYSKCVKRKFMEMTDIRWVPASTLFESSLSTCKNFLSCDEEREFNSLVPLRSAFKINVIENFQSLK